VEQIVRAAIYKEMKNLDYRGLEYAQQDSRVCEQFVKTNPQRLYSFQVWQKKYEYPLTVKAIGYTAAIESLIPIIYAKFLPFLSGLLRRGIPQSFLTPRARRRTRVYANKFHILLKNPPDIKKYTLTHHPVRFIYN
jgi:hypothetical protein